MKPPLSNCSKISFELKSNTLHFVLTQFFNKILHSLYNIDQDFITFTQLWFILGKKNKTSRQHYQYND